MMKLLATMPMGAWALSHSDVADAALHTHTVLDELEQAQPRAAFVPKFFSRSSGAPCACWPIW